MPSNFCFHFFLVLSITLEVTFWLRNATYLLKIDTVYSHSKKVLVQLDKEEELALKTEFTKKKSPTQIFHKMTIIISILLTLWYLCIKLPRNKYKFPCSSSFTDGVVYRKTWVSSRKKNFVSFPCQILNN